MKDKIFDMDNPFFSFMGRMADYCILNLLVMITSIPVVTIGASLEAMHETLHLMADDREGALIRTYIRIFVLRLRSASKVWLVLLLTGCLLYFDLMVSDSFSGSGLGKLLWLMLGSLSFIWLMIFTWIFLYPDPEDTVSRKMGNALRRAVLCFPSTVLMIFIEIIPLAVLKLSTAAFAAYIMPVYAVIGISASGKLCGILSLGAMNKLGSAGDRF